jgi:hypothetical protein
MSHTPGPWVVSDDVEGLYVSSRQSYKYVCDIEVSNPAYAGAESVISKAEAQANARLIAAAPDLLEALQNLVVWVEHLPGGRSAWEYVNALAAIAKAKGA